MGIREVLLREAGLRETPATITEEFPPGVPIGVSPRQFKYQHQKPGDSARVRREGQRRPRIWR